MNADIRHRLEERNPLKKISMSQGILLSLLLTLTAAEVRFQGEFPKKRKALPVLELRDANLSGISADGHRIAVSPELGVDEVYDVMSGRKLRTLRIAGSFGSQLSADGTRIVVFTPHDNSKSSAAACDVRLFEVDSGIEIARSNTCVEYDGEFVGCVVLYIPNKEGRMSGDLRFIAGEATAGSLRSKSASNKPGVWLWDIEKQKMARTFGDFAKYDDYNQDRWSQVKLTSDGRTLAATRFNHQRSENLETVVWDTRSGRVLLRLPFASRWLALSDDGRRLVTSREGALADIDGGSVITVGPRGQVFSVSPHSTTEPECRPQTEIWDIATRRRISEVRDGSNCNRLPATGGALSPDGKFLATASLNYVLLWDTETGRLLAAQPHDETDQDRVLTVTFTGDGHYVVMSSVNEVVKVWRVSDVLRDAGVNSKSPTASATVSLTTPPVT